MAVGQAVLREVLDVAASDAVELRLEQREAQRSAGHAGMLRDVLELHRMFTASGHGLGTTAQVALNLRGSETRAQELLCEAQLLVCLPGALEALDCGLLTVELARVILTQLGPLPGAVQLAVWKRMRERLIANEDSGAVSPPARWRGLLAGWVIAADPDDAVRRRQQAQDDGTVDYRRRDDGLTDLFATGLSGPDAHACLARIRARSVPFGPDDQRPAGRRRVDALVDLLLGRDPLPAGEDCERPDDGDGVDRPSGTGGCSNRPGCGCLPGAPVPCGADLSVLVPLGGALGTTDELAELVGHGRLEPDRLQELLLAAPRLRAVWVDSHGVPVAIGDRVLTPERGDPTSVREALLRLAHSPPGDLQPRHPDDHPPPAISAAEPTAEPHGHDDNAVLAAAALGRSHTLGRSHPVGTPGAYRVPTRLRRFLTVRRPLCEWPGCGARATRCDMDHDLAWPDGPTCACNLGPLCRRHHRIKQLGWTKTRTPDAGARWTGPTGRSWTSPVPHQSPAAPVRPVPSLPGPPDPLDELSPLQREEERWFADPANPIWDDPAGLELRADDLDPHDSTTGETDDPLRDRLLHTDTRWTLDLDSPYLWIET